MANQEMKGIKDIYISGSLAYDRIMDFPGKFADYILPDKIHVLNVCFNVNSLVEKFGGTAGNIAYTLSLFGERPFILATIGKDYLNYFEWLEQNNISTEGIKIIRDEFTAGAYITTDLSDNQITGFNPGAMKYPSEYPLEAAYADRSVCLIAPGNLQDMIRYAAVCRERQIPYICDPGQSLSLWEPSQMKEWLNGSAMLISNDYELEMIVKITGLAREGILSLTGIIITTLGEKGSVIITPDGEEHVPAAKAREVSDPTGAGDAFRAALLRGITLGLDLRTAARMGSVGAVYAVEKYGTQEHRFTALEYEERYRQTFGEF